jgi:hypothetical protein
MASVDIEDQARVDTWRAGPGSSLASTDHPQPITCEYVHGRVIVDLVSGSIWPDGCRTLMCPVCLPVMARRRTLAITLARPYRMVRLSLIAGEQDEAVYQTARRRIALIRRNLKRKGIEPGEWTWTIERNPKETGYHAHALQRGEYVSQNALQEACEKAGAGFPHINAIKRKGKWVSSYGLKNFGADGYGLKTFRPSGNPRDSLAINGGALEHHSRGFYHHRGGVMRVRDMERCAIEEYMRDTNRTIVVCIPEIVDSVLAARHDIDRVNSLVSQGVCETRNHLPYRQRRRAPSWL